MAAEMRASGEAAAFAAAASASTAAGAGAAAAAVPSPPATPIKVLVPDLQDAVRVLSEMSIVLEDWSTDRERNAKRLDKMLKRYTSRLRSMYEWAEREDLSRPMFLPQSFLQHVDAGQSPNVWVKELITSTTQRHDQARGQFRGVKRMREVFDELLLQEGQDREGEGEGEKADSPQQPTGVPAAKQGKKAERETMGQAAGPAEAAPPVEDGPERKREAEGGTEGVMQSR